MTTQEAQATRLAPGTIDESSPLAGLRIIDCDAHFTEPPDLWTSRVSESFKDRVPVQRTVDGRTDWYVGGEMWANSGGNTIAQGHKKILGATHIHPFEEIDPSAWDVGARLELMDVMGVSAQILYPNAIGFASNHIFAIEAEDDRYEILRLYNDFYVDVQTESAGRLYPQAMVPIWDMDLTVREMTRLIELGIRGFTLSDKPELLGLPELHEPFYAPMWDLFNESGTVANFHVGSGRRRAEFDALHRRAEGLTPVGAVDPTATLVANPSWRCFGRQRGLVVSSIQSSLSNIRIIANLCMSDLFDRYPKVKIVSAESGVGWVPFVLEALEYQFDQMVTVPDEVGFAKRRPTEYFRDHLYVSFWFETVGPTKLLDDVGVNNVLLETDIPHPTCLYPGAREHFEFVLGQLDPAVRKRVAQDNALELYKIS